MSRYCSNPVTIEAALFDGQRVGEPDGNGGVRERTAPDWLPAVVRNVGLGADALVGEIVLSGSELLIGTLEGTMRASPGDYIVRGTRGELYPCKPDVFATKYRPEDQ